ncbi:cytochrome b/b6 domain-containing protein [Aureibacter tunicatorum]|uniref:Cytochrome b561 n=1 Tax=Aureibacter tunicatorum TaxID=866807 RepID=A0AAE3XSL8_9BACT|nr:cytochrome b/b6 domain-containing protein [Aureibacter tunicatorum]MDR6241852.1 cytochrome b561 [Aureibacter tunicatorum]BDD07099.1 hypothetical protein AUTU_45820 [Aureibacter tunicatorum]
MASSNNYSKGYRLWHWLNAFAMLGILGTVILRKTFFSWRTNAALIQEKLATNEVEFEQAKSLAKAIRAPMWDWHYIFGFALIFLILIRLGQIVMKKDVHNLQNTTDAYSKMKKGIYWFFYLALMFMSITGIALYFKTELGISKDFSHDIKEIHEVSMWIFFAFTPLHLIGVIKDELTKRNNEISRMIHGGKAEVQVPEKEIA